MKNIQIVDKITDFNDYVTFTFKSGFKLNRSKPLNSNNKNIKVNDKVIFTRWHDGNFTILK